MNKIDFKNAIKSIIPGYIQFIQKNVTMNFLITCLRCVFYHLYIYSYTTNIGN